MLDQLYFDEEVLESVREALKSSHTDERREHEDAIKRCQAEYKRLEDRLNAIYLDKLDGRIDQTFHDRMAKAWKTDQVRLLREIERHTDAEHSYMDDGIKLLELARNARELFAKQEAHEKKRLLNLVLSNSIWRQGEVEADFRQPFDLLVKTTAKLPRRMAAAETYPQVMQFGWGARIRTWDGGTKTRCLTAWLRPNRADRLARHAQAGH